MSEGNSSSSRPEGKPAKPAKPYPEFPLYAHATKRWAKQVRGKTHFFGPWDDPDGALALYMEQKDTLHAGRKPRLTPDAGVTVKDACNAYLNHTRAKLDAGEVVLRTFKEAKAACDLIVEHFGKSRRVDDLDNSDFAAMRKAMAKRWGPTLLGNTIQRVRSVFKYALESGLVEKPVRFGVDFKRPTKKVLRINRARKGLKLFTPEEVRLLLDNAGVHLRAMIMLAVNCGLGNNDCGRLPASALDLDKGTLNYPRPKTGINRRCVLWPETTQAVRDSLALRPEPKDPDNADLVFVTKRGLPWAKEEEDSPVAKEFTKLLNATGVARGRGFYCLRHTFRTVADEAKDQPAADLIMGHESGHMSTVYRERIRDERLRAVVNHVRAWLFDTSAADGEGGGA